MKFQGRPFAGDLYLQSVRVVKILFITPDYSLSSLLQAKVLKRNIAGDIDERV
jgi:hypothetical protein